MRSQKHPGPFFRDGTLELKPTLFLGRLPTATVAPAGGGKLLAAGDAEIVPVLGTISVLVQGTQGTDYVGGVGCNDSGTHLNPLASRRTTEMVPSHGHGTPGWKNLRLFLLDRTFTDPGIVRAEGVS